jgi:tRNA threonylcarbamoyl adenosine modification protein YeaZ
MKGLFLNLASHHGLLALSSEKNIITLHKVDHRIGDHEVVPYIEKLLQHAHWTYRDLTHVACVTGPGGFTSLRVGVATANALMWSLKIPLVGIHLSDLYAALTPKPPLPAGRGGSLLWLHSTKKHELFVRGFGIWAKEFSESECVTINDFLGKITNDQLPMTNWTGELIPEHRTILEKNGFEELPLRPIEEILPQFLSVQNYTQHQIVPWYGRGW